MLQRIYETVFKNKAGMWTAIFTGVLCAFTYFLFQVSRQSDDTARGQARAFLSFDNFSLGPRLNDDKGAWVAQEIEVNWKNSGTTPAKNVVIQSNSKIFLEDLDKSYDFPLLPPKIEGAVGPQGLYSVDISVPVSQLKDVWHGRARLFIWGTAIYKDVFPGDADRISEFCFEASHITVGYMSTPIVPKGQPFPPLTIDDPNSAITTFQRLACNNASHSCCDDDCKDYPDRVKDMRQ